MQLRIPAQALHKQEIVMQSVRSLLALSLLSGTAAKVMRRWVVGATSLLATLAVASPATAADIPDIEVQIIGPDGCQTGSTRNLCRYTVLLKNSGEGQYDGPLFFNVSVRDDVPAPPGGVRRFARLVNYSAFPYRCHPGGLCSYDLRGSVLDCQRLLPCKYDAARLPKGAALQFQFFYSLPAGLEEDFNVEHQGGIRTCASMYWPMRWMANDFLSRIHVFFELTRLRYLDFDDLSDLTGVLGSAIKEYQMGQGIEVTGEIDSELLRALFPDSAQLAEDGQPANDRACETTPVDAASGSE